MSDCPEERGVIQLVWYKGLSGGFSSSQTPRCRVVIKGLDGNDHFFSDPYGIEPGEAKKIAEKWSGITGFPVKIYAEKPVVTHRMYHVDTPEDARKRIEERV